MFYFNSEVDSEERYDPVKLIDTSEGFPDIITSHFYNELPSVEAFGEYTVDSEEGNAPLLAYNIYSSVEFHEILLTYNHILDISDIKLGDNYNYPSLTEMERLYFKLQALQRNSLRQ